MNYIVYGKKIGDRCYGAINLHEGKVGVGLVYATLIPDCDRAKMYADKLAEMVPGFIFQVRGAGTRKVYYGVITSQSYETLCKVKELDPEIETGYILALGVGTYYDLPAADFFSVESTFITSGMVQQIHLRGKTVSAWTVNRTEDARALLSLGVDDVITDKPEMVQDLLNEDADLDRNLVLMRDRLKDLLGLTESADSEVDPDDSAIEEVLEDPEELLDQA